MASGGNPLKIRFLGAAGTVTGSKYLVSTDRERVLVATRTLDLTRVRIEGARLAEVVEAQVGDRDVLLEFGHPRHELTQALGEHHVVVADAQQIREQRRVHICPTSSGMDAPGRWRNKPAGR